MKNDIQNREDIIRLVDTFYGRVRRNELLGAVFNPRLEGRWPEHLEKMYDFWQTVLLYEHTYSGHPFAPHATMPIQKEHFDTWVQLFTETVYELFEGPVADDAAERAARMSLIFQSKLYYIHTFRDK